MNLRLLASCSRGVVVITCASHAQGPRFDPGREHFGKESLEGCLAGPQKSEPDVIRTRNLLIWSQTRYRCATGPSTKPREFMQNAYNTRDSQAVTHPSTNRARRCLTAVIRREPVCSTWYGRRQQKIFGTSSVSRIQSQL